MQLGYKVGDKVLLKITGLPPRFKAPVEVSSVARYEGAQVVTVHRYTKSGKKEYFWWVLNDKEVVPYSLFKQSLEDLL